MRKAIESSFFSSHQFFITSRQKADLNLKMLNDDCRRLTVWKVSSAQKSGRIDTFRCCRPSCVTVVSAWREKKLEIQNSSFVDFVLVHFGQQRKKSRSSLARLEPISLPEKLIYNFHHVRRVQKQHQQVKSTLVCLRTWYMFSWKRREGEKKSSSTGFKVCKIYGLLAIHYEYLMWKIRSRSYLLLLLLFWSPSSICENSIFFTLLAFFCWAREKKLKFRRRWRRQSGKLGKHLPEKCLTFLFVFCMIWFFQLLSISLQPSYLFDWFIVRLQKVSAIVPSQNKQQQSGGCQEWLRSASSTCWARIIEHRKRRETESTVISSTESQSSRLPPCHREPSFHLLYISPYFPHFPRLLIFLDDVVVLPSLHALYTLFSFANWRHKLLTQHPPDALNIYLIYMMMIHAETQWDVDDEKGK